MPLPKPDHLCCPSCFVNQPQAGEQVDVTHATTDELVVPLRDFKVWKNHETNTPCMPVLEVTQVYNPDSYR